MSPPSIPPTLLQHLLQGFQAQHLKSGKTDPGTAADFVLYAQQVLDAPETTPIGVWYPAKGMGVRLASNMLFTLVSQTTSSRPMGRSSVPVTVDNARDSNLAGDAGVRIT